MAHASILEVKVATSNADTILKAITPELKSIPSRRIKASIRCVNGGLLLCLEAEDLVALRAGMNTFLRWIAAIEKCVSLVDSK